MGNATTTSTILGRLDLAWARPPAGAGGPAAGVRPAAHGLRVPAPACAGRSQKRFTMASTLINGWPPGPSDGSP